MMPIEWPAARSTSSTTLPWPAGPKGHFLRGHVPELGPDWVGGLLRYAREYGDFVPLRLGRQQAILLSHPEYVEQVLVSRHRDFARTSAVSGRRRLLGSGLGTTDGEPWRRQRRLVQPAFHRDRVEAFGDVAVHHAEQLLRIWQDGEVRDLHAEMLRLTENVIATILFGADPGSDVAEFGAAILAATMGDLNPPINSLLLALANFLPMPGPLRYHRAARRVDRAGYAIIARRRAAAGHEDDVLAMLLRSRNEDGAISDQEIRDQLVNLFLAGYETTAVALSWTWYLLARHPEIDGRLLVELRRVLGGRAPTVADLPHLAYTERVIREVLRLYPSVATIKREAVRDCEIGGYRVPRGTIVLMSPWVVHRDPRHFEQPEEFRPERWADGMSERLRKFAYFPFAGGPHTCIGNRLAEMELALVMATIAQRFRIELAPGHEVKLRSYTTLRPHGGMWAIVHRR